MVPGPGPVLEDTLDAKAARLGDALAFWAIAVFCIFLFFALYWIPAARKLRALTREEAAITEEIQTLETENGRLDRRLDALYNDPYYVERVARSELGFQQEGERPIRPRKIVVGE